MTTIKRILIFICFWITVGCFNKSPQTVAPIAVETLFRNPEKTYYQLSPNGKYLAYLAPYENRMNIFVQQLLGDSSWRVTSISERDIVKFGWASDERLFFLRDEAGDENYFLSTVAFDGSGYRELTRFAGVRTGIVDPLEEDPQAMLIELNQRDRRIFDVYRIDLSTGQLQLEIENPGNYSAYLSDQQGIIRLITTTDGVSNGFLYRENVQQPFRKVLETNYKETFRPVFFDPHQQGRVYAVSNIGRDKTAAIRFDFNTGKEDSLLFEAPNNDVNWIGYSRKRKTPTVVYYVDWKGRMHFLDAIAKGVYDEIRKQLGSSDEVNIVSIDKSEEHFIVRTYSDRTLGAFYYYHCPSARLEKLSDAGPWLKKEEMAEVKPISYQSRDGLTIHGYLTIPQNVEAEQLPVIVMPHGGPWARDFWRFDANVQFFANRGYAVLQMNFRGSTGYGRAFWEAGFKQWGKKMQDDITDGVNYLIQQGLADPQRIAIFGASYGGYAALAGLAFTPEIYRCGIDYVGVSNLFTLLQTIPPYWEQEREMYYEMIGHPVKDSLYFVEVSPVFHAQKIKAPLMVIQGARDPRVKKAESDQIVEALAKNGITVDYIVREDEGHGFRNEENRIALYKSIEKFLAENL